MVGDSIERLKRATFKDGVLEIETLDGERFRYDIDNSIADIMGYALSKAFPHSRFYFSVDEWEIGPPIHVEAISDASVTIINGPIIKDIS